MDGLPCAQAWNCWDRAAHPMRVAKKAAAAGGASAGTAASQATLTRAAGLKVVWQLLANSRSVIVQGRWWWPWKAAIWGPRPGVDPSP